MSTVIVVEGESDKAALVAAAGVLGHDLSAIPVLVMNGAGNVVRFVTEAIARGRRVAGMYDTGEAAHIVRALAAAGLTDGRDPAAVEENGFFACEPDLETELIGALGPEAVVDVVAGQRDDLRRLRSMQQMPEWRGRPVEDQLRRWLGSGGSRKIRYASLLVAAMTPEEIPQPLRRVLEFATS